jgi:hypothetical protein
VHGPFAGRPDHREARLALHGLERRWSLVAAERCERRETQTFSRTTSCREQLHDLARVRAVLGTTFREIR